MTVRKHTKKQKNESNELDKMFNRFLEEIKITNDYLKHVATLDTGSIVLIATFLSNYSNASEKVFAIIAIYSFTASMISVVLSHSLFVRRLSTSVTDLKRLPSFTIKNRFFIPTFLAYIFCLVGIASLAIFITSNI
jgi:hypothetical protein